MKNKIIKTLTVGLSCLMLTLTIFTGGLNHNSTSSFKGNHVHIDEESPHPL